MKTRTFPSSALVPPSGTRFARRAFAALAVMLLLQLCSLPLRGQDFTTAMNTALECNQAAWYNDGWWMPTTSGALDGVDAAMCRNISSSSGETSSLSTWVSGPTPLGFWWRLINGAASESLTFEVDGVVQTPVLTGTTDWQWWEGSLGEGSHLLSWRCARIRWSAAAGYLDQLVIGSPVPAGIAGQPSSTAVSLGGTATFNVIGSGTMRLSYQWLKDGSPVGSGTDARLVISPVVQSDAGSYWVIVTNRIGHATSEVATLTVLNPGILSSPASLIRNAGESATFSVTAGGTPTFSYQWRKDGQPRVGATAASFTLNNLQFSDAGTYDVVVTNLYGRATSAVALLTINAALADSFAP